MRVGKNNRKDGLSTTIFSITGKKKLAYRCFFSMHNEESCSAGKRMWKFTPGVLTLTSVRDFPVMTSLSVNK